MIVRAAAAALGVVLALSACAIQPDPAPRDIPGNDGALPESVDPPAGEPGGSSRIYLLTNDEDSGERQLRSVPRDVDPTATPVLTELFKGPSEQELDVGLRTAIPEELVLNTARIVAGTLAVDVSPEILELPGSALRLAVAQIVFTASQLEGVRSVRLARRRRDPRLARRQRRAAGVGADGLRLPGLAESSQPPYPAVPSQPAS